jgi:hypothetical protein
MIEKTSTGHGFRMTNSGGELSMRSLASFVVIQNRSEHEARRTHSGFAPAARRKGRCHFHVRFGAGCGGIGRSISVPKFGHRNEFDRLAIKRA